MRFRFVSVAVIVALGLGFLALLGNGPFRANSNSPPTASFSYSPDIPTPGQSIVFNASLSRDPDGVIAGYRWDFGDGNVTVVETSEVSHLYPLDGSYTVELTVVDNLGATGVASAVIEVSTEVYFRVVYYGTLVPLPNVQTTVYYYDGTSWVAAPTSSNDLEIRYDRMTEPDLANTDAERFRNPGSTASILRHNASNIGFDIHPSYWKVYFKFQWGSFVTYWPNETTKVYTYKDGTVETHYYSSGHRACWDSSAGRYVIRAKDIPADGVSPTGGHPVVVGVFCQPPPTNYYLTVKTTPSGITSIPGEGLYPNGTSVMLTAPTYVESSSTQRYRFTYWDVDGNSKGDGISAISVLMTANHTATAHYISQYLVTFDQTGVGNDFAGTVVTVDGIGYKVGGLPVLFWWDEKSNLSYSFGSPLIVNGTCNYTWTSTSGLSDLQSGTLNVTASGNVIGNYALTNKVTFDQLGIGPDFVGTAIIIDSVPYSVGNLPVSFGWAVGSSHIFAFQSPLTVNASAAYLWTSSTGLSTLQSGNLTVSTFGSIIGHYALSINQTQYYLNVTTNPPGIATPSGTGWYDANTNATISTPAFIDIIPGLVRYRFNGWTTEDLSEIADPTRSPTQVFMDKSKIVTANYAVQYLVTFDKTGVSSDYYGIIVTVDGVTYDRTGLPSLFWWDSNTVHSFTFESSLIVTDNVKQYAWDNTTGLSNERSGTLTVTAYGNVTGNYKTQHYLSVSSAHDLPGPASGWIDYGSNVTAFVNSPDPGPTGTRYLCTGWIGTGSVPVSGGGTTLTFIMTQASSITWNWNTQYLLKVETNPPGIAVIPGSGWYNSSANVTLTAPTPTDYDFLYWMVDVTSQGNGTNPITVQMNEAHTATAYYSPKAEAYTLTITATAGGTTSPAPGTYTYVLNTNVQVYANPSPNYLFDHWMFNGGNAGSVSPYSVTMNMNHTLEAVFVPIPPLTLSINPPESSIQLDQKVIFTSAHSGGTAPYSYQWYLDGNPVSSAVQDTWTFTPSATGVYYVYLRITDTNNNTAQSAAAKVIVTPPHPVGGSSVSLQTNTTINKVIVYTSIVAVLGFCSVAIKRRRK